MRKIKFSLVFTGTAISILLFATGCATRYDILPRIPEYSVSGKTYNTSATIEFIASGNKLLDQAFMRCLQENNYQDIISGAHYKGSISSAVRIAVPLNWHLNVLRCQDGVYLESRVIVMVRHPGEHTSKGLTYPKPRYFQAFAQKNIGKEQATPTHWQETLNQAMNNLFTIDEFKQALEP